MKNVTDFIVADSVRRDIKVLATKTRYTVVSLIWDVKQLQEWDMLDFINCMVQWSL